MTGYLHIMNHVGVQKPQKVALQNLVEPAD